MISQRVVKKPRKRYHCAMCERPIAGPHIYCYGGEEFVGHPSGIRICAKCALDKDAIVEDTYDFAEKYLKPLLSDLKTT